MIPPPRNTLVSFYYFAKFDLDALDFTTMIGDSGAYSAHQQGTEVSTADLVEWASRWSHRLAWLASLDVIGDAAATRRNWEQMCAAGLPGVPTLHAGGDWREMDWYASQGVDFMGLGGLVLGVNMAPAAKMRWLVQVFKYAQERHPNMRFHGWGITRKQYLRLPWFSVDSSYWAAAAHRYGVLDLRHPRTGRILTIALDGKQAYQPEVALLLRDHYGCNPSDIAAIAPANRQLRVQLALLSASVQEQQWRRLHRHSAITAPAWGRLGGWNYPTNCGPHYHLVLDGRRHQTEALQTLHATERATT